MNSRRDFYRNENQKGFRRDNRRENFRRDNFKKEDNWKPKYFFSLEKEFETLKNPNLNWFSYCKK